MQYSDEDRILHIIIHGKDLKFLHRHVHDKSIHYYKCKDLITGDSMQLRVNRASKFRKILEEEIENKDVFVCLSCSPHGKVFVKYNVYETTYGYVRVSSQEVTKMMKSKYPELLI